MHFPLLFFFKQEILKARLPDFTKKGKSLMDYADS